MYRIVFSIVILIVILVSCKKPKDNYDVVIPSPNGQLHLHFNLYNGEPYYLVYLGDEIIVSWSLLGFKTGDTETLQEDMLALEIGPIRNDEDISPLLAGEKYNSLKIHLQKRGNSEIGYDVVFLIYNETIVLWYEYATTLKKIKANLKENTELDLNMKNQEWQLLDTIPMTDTLFLPVSFKSDMGIGLSFSEINSKGIIQSYLLQRKENIPEFFIKTLVPESKSKLIDQRSKIETNKKSIHIYRNN